MRMRNIIRNMILGMLFLQLMISSDNIVSTLTYCRLLAGLYISVQPHCDALLRRHG